MGENADIKHYNFHPPDERLTLFPTTESKSAVVVQLLEARWLSRAAALGAGSRTETSLGKRYDEPAAVRWDDDARTPAAFIWRRRNWVIDEILATWVIEKYWWDDVRRASRSYWRVIAGGGVFDLYFDRIAGRWFMGAALD